MFIGFLISESSISFFCGTALEYAARLSVVFAFDMDSKKDDESMLPIIAAASLAYTDSRVEKSTRVWKRGGENISATGLRKRGQRVITSLKTLPPPESISSNFCKYNTKAIELPIKSKYDNLSAQ